MLTATATNSPDPDSSSDSPEQAPKSNNASSSPPPRAPISLPNYTLGDEARSTHFNATSTRQEAAIDAKSLTVGDAAFILRSDRKWAYAIVTEREEGEECILRFLVDKKKNRKSFPEDVWGKYIRVIKVDADELERLEAEDGATGKESVASSNKEEEKNDKSVDNSEKLTLILGEFSSEVGSWFSAKFGTIKEAKENKAADDVDGVSKPETTDSEDAPSPPKDTPAELKTTKSKSLSSSFFNALPLPLGIFNKKTKSFDETKAAGTGESDTAVANKDEESDVTKVTTTTADEESTETPATAAEAETKRSNKNPSTTAGEDEARDATEETPTSDEESTPTAEEETGSSAAVKETSSELEIPKPVPIKLLQTPIQFYKAATMMEDPAAAALAATSFADTDNEYGLGQQGVTVVENDPSAAATAESLAHDRVYGHLDREGVIVVETMRKQGIAIVEAE